MVSEMPGIDRLVIENQLNISLDVKLVVKEKMKLSKEWVEVTGVKIGSCRSRASKGRCATPSDSLIW